MRGRDTARPLSALRWRADAAPAPSAQPGQGLPGVDLSHPSRRLRHGRLIDSRLILETGSHRLPVLTRAYFLGVAAALLNGGFLKMFLKFVCICAVADGGCW